MTNVCGHRSRPGAPNPLVLSLLRDSSAWSLVVSNIVTIVIAVLESWPPGTVMWVYWSQSVIIGGFNVLRILTLKEFSTSGVLVGGKPVVPTPPTKYYAAGFFTVHYGGFHGVYALFLLLQFPTPSAEWPSLLGACGIFLANHGFSFLHNLRRQDRYHLPNLGTIMFFPYVRIIPMHLTILFGHLFGSSVLVLFMSLKLAADVAMHAIEHIIVQPRVDRAGTGSPTDAREPGQGPRS